MRPSSDAAADREYVAVELVALADAAVLVPRDREPGVRRRLKEARARGIPVRLVGEEGSPKVKTVRPAEASEAASQDRRGLPDSTAEL